MQFVKIVSKIAQDEICLISRHRGIVTDKVRLLLELLLAKMQSKREPFCLRKSIPGDQVSR